MLPCLAAGCILSPAGDDADAAVPRTPAQAACAGVVKQAQVNCSPDLLRAGSQGPECSWTTRRIVNNCGQPR